MFVGRTPPFSYKCKNLKLGLFPTLKMVSTESFKLAFSYFSVANKSSFNTIPTWNAFYVICLIQDENEFLFFIIDNPQGSSKMKICSCRYFCPISKIRGKTLILL